MKVTQVTVNAGRTFNHPYESYSNLRPSVTFTAQVEDGEDYRAITHKLQAEAEQMVEDHKQHMLDSLHKLEEMNLREREIAKLDSLIKTSQSRLEALRCGEQPSLSLASPESDWREDR